MFDVNWCQAPIYAYSFVNWCQAPIYAYSFHFSLSINWCQSLIYSFHFSLSNWCQSPISKKEKEWFMLKKIPYELSDFKRIRIYTGDGRFEK